MSPPPGRALLRPDVLLAAATALVLCLLHATPLGWINLPVVGAASALWLPSSWSWLKRLSLGLALLYAVNTLVGHLAHLAGLPLQVWMVSAAVYAATIVRHARAPIGPRRGALATGTDLWAFGGAAAAAALALPTMFSYGSPGTIPIVGRGEDTASHFAIFRNVSEQHGLVYGRSDMTDRLWPALVAYPQASHLMLSTAMRYLAEPRQADTRALVSVFSVLEVGTFALFALYFWYLLLELLPRGGAACASRSVAFVAAALLGWGLAFSRLLCDGFFSQFGAYAAWLGACLLLAHADAHPGRLLPLALAFFVEPSVAASWYFLTPVSLAVFGLWSARNFRARPLRHWLALWAGLLVLDALYVGSSASREISPVLSINAGGGAIPVPSWLLGCSLGAALVFFVPRREAASGSAAGVALFALLAAAGFSGALYAYQLATAGKPSYYFYKSQYTLLVPLALLGSAGLGAVVERVAGPLRTLRPAARGGLLLAVVAGEALVLYPLAEKPMRALVVGRPTPLRRDAYEGMLELRRVPRIERRAIQPITEDPLECYLMFRWFALIAGGPASRERVGSIQSRESYQAELFRFLTSRRFSEVPVVFDPRGVLRRSCDRRFFELSLAGGVLILPERSARWRRRCGELPADGGDRSSASRLPVSTPATKIR